LVIKKKKCNTTYSEVTSELQRTGTMKLVLFQLKLQLVFRNLNNQYTGCPTS